MRHTQSSLLLFLTLLFLIGSLVLPAAHAQQVSTSWNGGTGNWSVSTNWNPAAVPNNAGSTTYGVTIAVQGSAVAMDVLNDTVDNLSLGLNLTPSTSSLTINSGDSLTVMGSVSVGGTLFGGPSTQSSLVNNGALTVGGQMVSLGIFNNSGVFIYSGTDLDNQGAITNTSGAFFINTGNVFLSSMGEVFNNAGTLINAAGANWGGEGNIIVNSVGASIVNFGTFHPAGNTIVNNGTITNNGVYLVDPVLSGELDNNNTFINAGTLSNPSFARLNNAGVLDDTGTLSNGGRFENSGVVRISSTGLFTTSTNYTQTAGSTIVNGTLTATGGAIVDIEGGKLSGTGTINSDVLLKGIMSPGSSSMPGALTINGNYEQTSTGVFDEVIKGASSNGVLDVTGVLALDPGSLLKIILQGGFDPVGDSFTILDYGSLIGEFSNGTSFFADGFNWTLTYGPNDAVLTAVSAPEPGTMPLIAIGLLAFFAYRKMDKSQRLA